MAGVPLGAMSPPLSPRAQEILEAIERDAVARRGAIPEPPAPPPGGAATPEATDTDPARLMELVAALAAQAERSRRRLGTLTAALRELDEPTSREPISSREPDQVRGEAPSTAASTLDAEPDRADALAPASAPAARPERSQGPAVIDLHHHLLPGIDDGPATLAASLELARAAVAAGTTTVLATPHVSWDYPANTAASIAAGVATLREALAAEGIPLEVLPGAEVAVTRAVDLVDDELEGLRLGHGPYLLVECPFTPSAVGFEFLLEALLARGNQILLAHPERSPAFQHEPDLLERLVARGMLAQVTAGSLSGGFGRTVRDFAHRLVRDGLVHVIASDAHSVDRRPPSILDALDEEGYAAQAGWFTDAVPSAILDGSPIPPMPALPARPRSGLKRLLDH